MGFFSQKGILFSPKGLIINCNHKVKKETLIWVVGFKQNIYQMHLNRYYINKLSPILK